MAVRLPKIFRYFKDVRIFLINVSLVVALFISAIFLGIYIRSNHLLLQSMKEQAVSYLNLIVKTRTWNSSYGGVYVEKRPGVEANPYLREIGKEPDIISGDGRTFTMRNPAMMTREISQITEGTGGVRFRLVSLKPLNPLNAPDPFELKSLRRFEKGDREAWELDRNSATPVFRYMTPVYVEQPCMDCHEQQGYKTGDIRGGISVTIHAAALFKEMGKNRVILSVLSVTTLGLLLSIIYFMVWQLVRKLHEAQQHLREISVTDELTGLKNRRYIMGRLGEEFHRARRTGKPLGLIMFDIDHFKKINDEHGHPFGDIVLKEVAILLRENLREYDLSGRIGGEEFVVIAPDSYPDSTAALAERLRNMIRSKPIGDGDKEIAVTVSAGVTAVHEHDASLNAVITRADNALYKAKREGRDRVAIL